MIWREDQRISISTLWVEIIFCSYAENIIKTVSKRIDEVKNPSSFFDESNTMYKSYCELTEKFEHYENENRKYRIDNTFHH